jgi:Peptidase M15
VAVAGLLAGRDRLPLLNAAALDKLQALRAALAKSLIIRSAYRSPEHNRAVGGAKASKHMEGIAFDVGWRTTILRCSRRPPVPSASGASGSIRARASCTSMRPGAELGRTLPKAGDGLRGVDAAGKRGACRKPDAEGLRRGLGRHRRGRRRRGGPAGARLDAERCCRCCPISTPCAGCSSPSRSAVSPWRSMPASMIGSGAGGDRRPPGPARCRAAWPRRPAHRAAGRGRPPAPPCLPTLR